MAGAIPERTGNLRSCRSASLCSILCISSKFFTLPSKEDPDLGTEEMIDNNTIVNMVQDWVYIQNEAS